MSTRTQFILATVIVAITAGAVTLYARSDASQQDASGSMEGHDHAAMLAAGGESRPVRLTETGASRIGVTYATVEAKPLVREVKTVGIVSYDETRLTAVNPKIEGWIEHLYVDFTGAPVREGEPLLELYSPRLVSAQEELILARRLLDETAREGGDRARSNAETLLESARRRLAYWDVPVDEIAAIEERGTVEKTVTLRAPASGIVVEKNVVEGVRIMPGMNLYLVADLSRVWVEAEVFEKDLGLLREGQGAQVTLAAYPGETFSGVITYVYPTVSVDSRTGKIRLELANPGLKLKPGMYGRVEIEVIARDRTLMVPRSAVMATGERSVVFVQDADGTLIPRAVTTGFPGNGEIEILTGLTEGEVVVSSANFLIDAESNLSSAISEMEREGSASGQDPSEHEGHDMGAMTPDTAMPDTTGIHEGHDMGSMTPDTVVPDTTRARQPGNRN